MTSLRLLTIVLAAVALSASAAETKSPFNGTDLTGWKLRNRDPKLADTWVVVSDVKLDENDSKRLVGSGKGEAGKGVLLRQAVKGHNGTDLISVEQYGDVHLTVDFMVPRGSNSGVYLMGRYEVQVLDSFGKADARLSQGDVGAIYSAAKPSTNAAKAPGEWQTFEIVFRAPRFDAQGKKVANAKFESIRLNGKEIQKDVEVKGPTGGQIANDEAPTGPLMFQGDHGVVAYRNIKVTPLQDK